jgi:hypothetical protein
MNPHIFSAPTRLTDVVLTALSPREWRVTNGRIDAGDPSGLIGFIERTENGYEVLRLGSPLERQHFPSLTAACTVFVAQPGSGAPQVSRAA